MKYLKETIMFSAYIISMTISFVLPLYIITDIKTVYNVSEDYFFIFLLSYLSFTFLFSISTFNALTKSITGEKQKWKVH